MILQCGQCCKCCNCWQLVQLATSLSLVVPPASLTPLAGFRRCLRDQCKCRRCQWHRWWTFRSENCREFSKNINYGNIGGPEEDEVKDPKTLSLNKKFKNTDIFTFYNPRMEKQLLIFAAYVYSACEDKNITLGSLRHSSIEIINIKTRTIVYSTVLLLIGDRCF